MEKKSFWSKKTQDMTIGDGAKLVVILTVVMFAVGIATSWVIWKIEDIINAIETAKIKIKSKFSHKKWVGSSEYEEDEELN